MAATPDDRSPRRCGTATSSTPRPASPTSSTSTSTSSTRSPARRPSTACAWPAAPCAGPTSPSPPRTTTSPRPTSTSRSRTRSAPSRSRSCGATPPSSASRLYPMGDPGQGIVHVIGPEQGLTQPGMTIVCGDSHTVHPRRLRRAGLRHRHERGRARPRHPDAPPAAARRGWRSPSTATCPPASRPRTSSSPSSAASAPAAASATSSSTAARPSAALSMEGRMTVCNMSIEAGARAGLVAPDDTTFAYLEGRRHAPTGTAWEAAARRLADARAPTTAPPSTREVAIDAADARAPRRPGARTRARSCRSTARVPDPDALRRRRPARVGGPGPRLHGPHRRHAHPRHRRRHRVHRLVHQQPHRGPAGRGRRASTAATSRVERALVVPGSHAVKAQAEAEGLDRIFRAAGFDWREPGCSMCLAMNPDKLQPGERCASTSQPQLRGPPGPRRAHPPRVARRRRRHRRRRPLRHARRTSHEGRARRSPARRVPLARSDVDTDQIIPSDWLKRVERTGFGKGLFSEWRDDRDFVLNDERFAGATVLVAGPNFGTGSSAGSTPSGPSRTTASTSSSRPASPTSSATTARRTASCRCSSTPRSSSGSSPRSRTTRASRSPSTSSASSSRCPPSASSPPFPLDAVHAAPLPPRPRRHRPHPRPRGRHRRLRGDPTGLAPRPLVGDLRSIPRRSVREA